MYGYPYEGIYGYPYGGPGWGFGFGWGRGRGGGRGWGRGWSGNPYVCARFPWLPRWWWTGMYGPMTPFTGTSGMPYSPYYESSYSPYATPTTAMPSMTYPSPYAQSPYSTGMALPQIPKEQEKQMLEGQAAALQQQLDQIKKRLEELSKT